MRGLALSWSPSTPQHSAPLLLPYLVKHDKLHPVYFIRNLTFGEGFRFLDFSILEAWPSLIHPIPCIPYCFFEGLFLIIKRAFLIK